LIELEKKLPAILQEKERPGSAAARLDYATLCSCKGFYAAGARLYQQAFATESAENPASHRYAAACVAVLAGTGAGKDAEKLDDKERLKFRRLALQWLRAELSSLSGPDGEQPKGLRARRPTLETWTLDVRLSGVRDVAALARLPAEERA